MRSIVGRHLASNRAIKASSGEGRAMKGGGHSHTHDRDGYTAQSESRRVSRRSAESQNPVYAGAALVFCVIFAVSLAVPLGLDEAYWRGIAAMVANGGQLYRETIDNKTPLVFALIWLIEGLPGTFVFWRAVVVGAAGAAIWSGTRRLVTDVNWRTSWAVGVLTAQVLLLSELRLSIELLALAGVVAAMAIARHAPRKVLVAALLLPVAIDPRTVLLLPGIVLWLRRHRPEDVRHVAYGLTVTLTAAAAFVVFLPDLRFGLIELNLASRHLRGPSGLTRLTAAWFAVAGYLPLLLALDFRLRDSGKRTILAGAAAVPLVSLLPFSHYFIYVALGLALFVSGQRGPSSLAVGSLVAALGLAPLAIVGVKSLTTYERLDEESIQVSTALAEYLDDGDNYVVFGWLPQVVTERPKGYALRAPASLYLGMNTSRSEEYLSELDHVLSQSAAVVDTGSLSVPRALVYTSFRPAWDVFQAHRNEFSCELDLEFATLWLSVDRCPGSR